jgi:hypothetical protein
MNSYEVSNGLFTNFVAASTAQRGTAQVGRRGADTPRGTANHANRKG